jgi:hypothetical protein
MAMNQQPGADLGLSHGSITVGRGWPVPAALTFAFLVAVYLPDHDAADAGRGLIGAIGALYVVGVSFVLPRLVRGLLLRRGGWSGPVVLLGRDARALEADDLRPAWRFTGITGGLLVHVALAVMAWRVLAEAQAGTYPHAVSGLALAVNVVLAIAALAPVPGFGGWALLLAGADARNVPIDERVEWAVMGARLIALTLAVVGGAFVVASGHAMLMPFVGLAAGFTWIRAETARSLDSVERFFARHTAGELARGLTVVRRADEVLSVLHQRAREEAALVVSDEGVLLGAIGPRQISAALSRAGAAPRFAEAMVPVGRLHFVSSAAPGNALLAELAQHGFAVVRDEDRYAVAEAVDIGRQIHIWTLLGRWGRGRRDSTGGTGA